MHSRFFIFWLIILILFVSFSNNDLLPSRYFFQHSRHTSCLHGRNTMFALFLSQFKHIVSLTRISSISSIFWSFAWELSVFKGSSSKLSLFGRILCSWMKILSISYFVGLSGTRLDESFLGTIIEFKMMIFFSSEIFLLVEGWVSDAVSYLFTLLLCCGYHSRHRGVC